MPWSTAPMTSGPGAGRTLPRSTWPAPEKLLAAARDAGVKSVVLISTVSAFAGCRSLYGQAKLQIEDAARAMGAFVLRPGLVYSDNPGGMFGRLVGQVRGARFVPILCGGRQTQYLVHDEDLGNLVEACLAGRVPAGTEPITVAHEQGWELKEILTRIAQALGKKVSFVPVPWRLVWLALKSLELAGARPNFRSDSLISMVYQNPAPSFAPLNPLASPAAHSTSPPGCWSTGVSPPSPLHQSTNPPPLLHHALWQVCYRAPLGARPGDALWRLLDHLEAQRRPRARVGDMNGGAARSVGGVGRLVPVGDSARANLWRLAS